MKLGHMRFRRYAGFFDWPDKQVKERGIVHDWAASFFGFDDFPFQHLKSRHMNEDPPDCEVTYPNGDKVGFEVTELVDEDSVMFWAQGKSSDYRLYEPAEISDLLDEILQEKDKKVYKGGPYASIYLIIHSDEPLISSKEIISELPHVSLKQTTQIERVFVMLPPFPSFGGEPREKSVNESYNIFQIKIGAEPGGRGKGG